MAKQYPQKYDKRLSVAKTMPHCIVKKTEVIIRSKMIGFSIGLRLIRIYLCT